MSLNLTRNLKNAQIFFHFFFAEGEQNQFAMVMPPANCLEFPGFNLSSMCVSTVYL